MRKVEMEGQHHEFSKIQATQRRSCAEIFKQEIETRVAATVAMRPPPSTLAVRSE
jgi:hypothetical protein